MQRIFVGDVQGCAAELDELIARAQSAFGSRFELWLVGDLVNRGPANLRVLERVHDLWSRGRARVVLGNHELALLRSGLGLRKPGPLDTLSDVLAHPDLQAWLDWIASLPLLVADTLEGTPFVMVHASLHPDWTLDSAQAAASAVTARLSDADRIRALLRADPARDTDRDVLGRLVSCRSVGSKGRWSPGEPEGKTRAWHAAWSKRRHDYGVVYGHWSLQGLHVAPRLRGLDTGCVHHGRSQDGFLTAWLPEGPEPFATPDTKFWQIRAHARYVFD